MHPDEGPAEGRVELKARWRATFGPLGALCGLVIAGTLAFGLATVRPGAAATSLSTAFVKSPDYLVWRLLITLAVLAALVGARVAAPLFADLHRRYPNANLASLVLVYVPGIAVAGVLPLIEQASWTLSWNALTVRVFVVLVIGAIALTPSVGVIWIVRDRVRRVVRIDLPLLADQAGDRIKELLVLGRSLTTALGIFAGLISLAVVAGGQLRLTLIHIGAPATEHPIAIPILYGTFFAAILAGLYIPAEAGRRQCAMRLREALYPTPADGKPTASWSEGRKRLSDLLALDAGITGSLGPTLSILSPLILSLLGYFLPTSGV